MVQSLLNACPFLTPFDALKSKNLSHKNLMQHVFKEFKKCMCSPMPFTTNESYDVTYVSEEDDFYQNSMRYFTVLRGDHQRIHLALTKAAIITDPIALFALT